MRAAAVTYLGGWADDAALDRLVADLAARAGLETERMPEGVRRRDTATERFWFNHGDRPVETPAGLLPPAGVLRVPRP
jgi:beta-galactosidase